MITPKSINRIIAIFAGAVTLIGGTLALREPLVGVSGWILTLDKFLLAAVAAAVGVALTFYIMNALLFNEVEKYKAALSTEVEKHKAILLDEKEKHEATRELLATAEYNLRDSEKLKYADVITGIPNESKWREDIKEIGSLVSLKEPYQGIFIDLDGFKTINTDYGYTTGDQVIRYFAQSIHSGMRVIAHPT